MTQSLTAGDPVRVADREPVSTDTRTGLFYPHYRSLSGIVAKLYDDGTAAVTVDATSLPQTFRTRHEAGSEAQRQKWLDGLSDEARNRLSAAEKQFSLRYTILVAATDLAKLERASLEDLDAAEARHLEELRQRKS